MQFDDKIKEIVYKRFKNSIKPLSKNSLSDIVYEEVTYLIISSNIFFFLRREIKLKN